MPRLQIEQPPKNLDKDIKDYLIRMFRIIDIALSNNSMLVVSNNLPIRPIKGKIYYFDRVIPDTDINSAGYWGYTTEWVFLG